MAALDTRALRERLRKEAAVENPDEPVKRKRGRPANPDNIAKRMQKEYDDANAADEKQRLANDPDVANIDPKPDRTKRNTAMNGFYYAKDSNCTKRLYDANGYYKNIFGEHYNITMFDTKVGGAKVYLGAKKGRKRLSKKAKEEAYQGGTSAVLYDYKIAYNRGDSDALAVAVKAWFENAKKYRRLDDNKYTIFRDPFTGRFHYVIAPGIISKTSDHFGNNDATDIEIIDIASSDVALEDKPEQIEQEPEQPKSEDTEMVAKTTVKSAISKAKGATSAKAPRKSPDPVNIKLAQLVLSAKVAWKYENAKVYDEVVEGCKNPDGSLDKSLMASAVKELTHTWMKDLHTKLGKDKAVDYIKASAAKARKAKVKVSSGLKELFG